MFVEFVKNSDSTAGMPCLCAVTSGPQLETCEGCNDLATSCLGNLQVSSLTGLSARVT